MGQGGASVHNTTPVNLANLAEHVGAPVVQNEGRAVRITRAMAAGGAGEVVPGLSLAESTPAQLGRPGTRRLRRAPASGRVELDSDQAYLLHWGSAQYTLPITLEQFLADRSLAVAWFEGTRSELMTFRELAQRSYVGTEEFALKHTLVTSYYTEEGSVEAIREYFRRRAEQETVTTGFTYFSACETPLASTVLASADSLLASSLALPAGGLGEGEVAGCGAIAPYGQPVDSFELMTSDPARLEEMIIISGGVLLTLGDITVRGTDSPVQGIRELSKTVVERLLEREHQLMSRTPQFIKEMLDTPGGRAEFSRERALEDTMRGIVRDQQQQLSTEMATFQESVYQMIMQLSVSVQGSLERQKAEQEHTALAIQNIRAQQEASTANVTHRIEELALTNATHEREDALSTIQSSMQSQLQGMSSLLKEHIDTSTAIAQEEQVQRTEAAEQRMLERMQNWIGGLNERIDSLETEISSWECVQQEDEEEEEEEEEQTPEVEPQQPEGNTAAIETPIAEKELDETDSQAPEEVAAVTGGDGLTIDNALTQCKQHAEVRGYICILARYRGRRYSQWYFGVGTSLMLPLYAWLNVEDLITALDGGRLVFKLYWPDATDGRTIEKANVSTGYHAVTY